MEIKKSLISCLICGLFITISAQAQTKKQEDIQAIKSMLGCYDVDFKYTETFSPEVDYEKAYDYTSAARELAVLVEESEDHLVIQHLLVLHDTMVIKHWRQDWIYEERDQFEYEKDHKWRFFSLPSEAVKGKWTQKVYQVDDSPRYCGSATWVHVDGRSEWFDKADSPLPRREYTKRDDYNVLRRGNRIIINENAWLHEQDNEKIIRANDEADQLLVEEKGYNTYKKVADGDACKAAFEWWQENKSQWAVVRDIWDDIYKNKTELKLNVEVEGKKLYEHLFYYPGKLDEQYVAAVINQYVVNPNN